MKSIAVFNNKGGVGKSTVTLFLADFLASSGVTIMGRKSRILVCDLDGQNSSAIALVGKNSVKLRQGENRTMAELVEALAGKVPVTLEPFLLIRPEPLVITKKVKLGEISVLVSDSASTFGLEQRAKGKLMTLVKTRLLPLLEKRFDIVLFDLAANLKPVDYLSMAVLQSVDHILVPTQPTALATNALEKSFAIINDAKAGAKLAGFKPPSVAGVVLNQTNKATKAYKIHAPEIQNYARALGSSVFDSVIPNTPAFPNATDDSLSYETLKVKYDTYYEHAKNVTRELARRCGYGTRQSRGGKVPVAPD